MKVIGKKVKSTSKIPRVVSFLFKKNKFTYIKQFNNDRDISLNEIFSMKSFLGVCDRDYIINSLNEDDFFKFKYPFIDISILNDQFTLIPLEYFEEDNCEAYLNYNTAYSNKKGLRFNIIPQFNSAIVFYYDEEIEQIFSEEVTEKLRITHTGFKFLNKIGNMRKDGFFINVYNDNLEIAVINDSKLIIYNIYTAKSLDDWAYYTQLIFKKLNIPIGEKNMYYFGKTDLIKSDIIKLSPFFESIEPGIEDYFESLNFTTLDLI